MSLRDKHPKEIVERCIAIELVKNNGAEIAKEMNINFVKEITEVDEDGKDVVVYELDYEYMLFECPMYQFQIYFQGLEKLAKEIQKEQEEVKKNEPKINTYEVKYYYFAQGMDKPDEKYLGIHKGISEDEVKDFYTNQEPEHTRDFYRSCLSVRQIS